MKKLKLLISAIAAGVSIGVGGAVFLSLDNKIAGALLFSLGLLTVVANKLALFTGKVGYLVVNSPKYLLDLAIIWIGNFIGAACVGIGFALTRAQKVQKAIDISNAKLDDGWLSVLILSILCGLLMFIAVNGYRKLSDCGKYIILVLPVAVFILSGYEHCVANMFYFSHAGLINLRSILYLLLMTLGNSIGGIIGGLYEKYIGDGLS